VTGVLGEQREHHRQLPDAEGGEARHVGAATALLIQVRPGQEQRAQAQRNGGELDRHLQRLFDRPVGAGLFEQEDLAQRARQRGREHHRAPHFGGSNVDAPTVTEIQQARRGDLGGDARGRTAAARAGAAGLAFGVGIQHPELNRDVRHARVLLHAPEEALHRRIVPAEGIREELAVGEHHRPLANIGAEALDDGGVARNQLTQRAFVRKLHADHLGKQRGPGPAARTGAAFSGTGPR